MEIKGAIFDMDGTLVDSLMFWDILWSYFGERYLNKKDFKLTPQDDKAVKTLTLKEAMELIHQNYKIGESGEELHAVANGMLEKFYSCDVKLKDGVKEFLENLYNKGVKLCVASATAPEYVSLALKHCEIEKYFLKIISCAEFGRGKEHPDVFLKALDFLGTPLEETFVFEDSLVALETAAKAGFPTVGIYDRYNNPYQEKIRQISNEYIAQNENLTKLI